MLTYYVVYRDEGKTRPVGIFVMDVVTGAALLWDHRQRAWTYDPSLVVRFLDDYRNSDRYENVARSAVEGLAHTITGGGKLPDEHALTSILEEGRRGAER